MSRPLLYIVPGHGFKSPGHFDPGAVSEGFQEAVSVRALAPVLAREAEALGLATQVDSSGHYHQRHTRMEEVAGRYSRVAVVHLHHDAAVSPSADHAQAMFDRRSKGGKALARHLGDELRKLGAPWGTDVRLTPTWDDRREAGPNAWLHRAFHCIDEVYEAPAHVSAALLELGFLTHPLNREWWRSGDAITPTAQAIARGAAAWLR